MDEVTYLGHAGQEGAALHAQPHEHDLFGSIENTMAILMARTYFQTATTNSETRVMRVGGLRGLLRTLGEAIRPAPLILYSLLAPLTVLNVA